MRPQEGRFAAALLLNCGPALPRLALRQQRPAGEVTHRARKSPPWAFAPPRNAILRGTQSIRTPLSGGESRAGAIDPTSAICDGAAMTFCILHTTGARFGDLSGQSEDYPDQ